MSKVTLYSASAGTGKTYTICEQIAGRIEKGLDPRRLLACTFTKKAAAELKSRVQGALLAKGLAQAAAALDLAPIGTVHSVGHRFVSRFALRLGLSPDLAVMPEGGDLIALKDILNGSNSSDWEELVRLEARLSMRGVGDEEDSTEPMLLRLLRLKRQNAISDKAFTRQLAENGRRFTEVLSGGAARGKGGFGEAVAEARELAAKAAVVLGRLSGEDHKDALASVRGLERDGVESWYELAKFAELKAGKSAGAEKALEDIKSFASSLRRHPGLAADCSRFLALIASEAIEVEKRYQEYKRERGLLDYTDMEAHFHRLVSEPSLQDDLRAEVDLVVVDEFQDTNPVQLAIFQALSALAPQTLWVGDHKQSIYAFNGAAPDLMAAVWKDPKVKRETLKTNRRSAEGIVDIANLVFSPVFGVDSKMEAHEPAQAEAAERWLLVAKNQDDEARALALALVQFLERSKRRRSEVAILVRTNNWAGKVAAALGEAGIPAALAVGGLLSTRQCAAVLAGLRLAADRHDSLAAASLLQLLEPPRKGTPAWLDARLSELAKANGSKLKPFDGHALLAKLELLDPRGMSPRAAVIAVIEALGLAALIGDWTEPARRAADLDSLLSSADTYEETALASGRSATLSGLIAYLEMQIEGGDDKREPPRGLDAVQILTYHRAKGLEWPVVILTQLDKVFKGTSFEPAVTGGDPARGKPLAGRRIVFWPHPFSGTKALGLNDDAEQTPEGRAATAVITDEEQRLLYVGFTRPEALLILATRVSILKAGDSHKHKWLDGLPSFAASLGKMIQPGKHKLTNVAGAVRVLRFDAPTQLSVAEAVKKQNWFSPPPAEVSAPILRYRHPSAEPGREAEFKLEPLPGPPAFKVPPVGIDPEDMGNAFHAYFSALPSLVNAPAGARLECARRVLRGYDLSENIDAAGLVAAGQRLEEFVTHRFPGARWLAEIPVTAAADGGSQWDGAIDLLLELQDGSVVVLDHKSFFGKEEHVKERAVGYSGQLAAYSAALRSCGRKLAGVGLHLPLGGQICWMAVEMPR
jgi:ATP-dependent exoDNAse (exonuclease V) beta subunit